MTDSATISALVFLVTQFGVAIWWASRITTLLRELGRDMKELKISAHATTARIGTLEQRLAVVESRCEFLHNQEKKGYGLAKEGIT